VNEPDYNRRVSSIIQMFAEAAARLERLLLEMLASGSKIGTARYKRRRLAEIQAVLAELHNEAIPEVERLVDYSVLHGLDLSGHPELDSGLIGDFATGINMPSVHAISDNLTNSLTSAIDMVGRRVNDVFRQATLHQVGQHLIEGTTIVEAAEALRQRLLAEGKTSFVDAAGKRWALDTYASMAIRTVTREAVTIGTVNGLAAAGDDLLKISMHANSCPICLPFEGKEFSITGRTPGYTRATREDLPPYHPNCSHHVAQPSQSTFAAKEAELLAGAAA
jgi:hypothetical protein